MCDDCKNYEPKVEVKEEWVDCTREYLIQADAAYISTHNAGDGYYSFLGDIYHILTKRHPYGHDVFKIERRAENKRIEYKLGDDVYCAWAERNGESTGWCKIVGWCEVWYALFNPLWVRGHSQLDTTLVCGSYVPGYPRAHYNLPSSEFSHMMGEPK